MKSKPITSLSRSLLIILLILPAILLNAQSTKDYTKEETLSKGDIVEILSGHNDIEINTWDKDLVRLEVSISVDAESKSDAAKIVSLFEESIEKTSKGVKIILNPFHEQIKSINTNNGETKMTLKNGEKLHYTSMDVSIEVYTSRNHALELENSFSDVSLGDMNAATEITLMNSSLKGNNLTELTLNASFSDALFGDADRVKLYCKSSDVEFKTVKTLSSESAFSEIEINELHTLEVSSQSDEYEIGKLHAVAGKASFTSLDIGTLVSSMVLKTQSATIEVDEVSSQFISIDLDCDFSTIELDIEDDNYQLDVEANFSSIDTPIGELESEGIFPDGIDFSGSVGDAKAEAKVKIRCNSCDVELH